MVVLLVWTLELVYKIQPGIIEASDAQCAVAFLVGIFPHIGLQALLTLIKAPIKRLVPALSPRYPLSDLDGLNIWHESRLFEEGIEDMENLATASLVDVLLNTRIPVERLIDWIDQSLLYLHLPKTRRDQESTGREQLRLFGIRTASDLEDLYKSGDPELIQKVEQSYDGYSNAPGALRTIYTVLPHEPNLYHVRRWKAFEDEALKGRLPGQRLN